MCDKTKSHLILGVCILLGLYFLGSSLGSHYFEAKELDRSVSVTGFSEKNVKADSVFWPISFVVKGGELRQSAIQMQQDAKVIKEFLVSSGINENEITQMQANVQYQDQENILRKGMLSMNSDSFSIEQASPNLFQENSIQSTDLQTQTNETNEQEEGDEDKKKEKYIISSTLLVRTNKVDLVISLSQKINELLVKNINISDQYNYNQIEYKFNEIEKIKQEMLKEASTKAYELAKNFAEDSNSALGRVKNARQGDFNIHSPNRYEEYMKKIRVESQVEYYLVD